MRRVFLFILVALAALAAGAYAFAGSPSQGMSAFALVDPNGGSPRLIDAHTNGFTSVSVGPAGPGDYCLTAAPGVDVVHSSAVASEEAFYSNALGVAAVRYPTAGPACGANQLEVKTFTDNPVTLSDQIGFTVNVP
jgi:hypothetical protein